MNLKKRKGHFLLLLIVFCANWGFSATPPPSTSPNALVLNGTNIVQIVDNNLFDLAPNTDHTFEGWFNFCTSGQLLNSNACTMNQAGYYLGVDGGGFLVFNGVFGGPCNSSNMYLQGSIPVMDNQWHHFVLKVSSTGTHTTAQTYVDGVLDVSAGPTLGTINNSNATLKIGAYTNMGGNYALVPQGRVDEFRIYDSNIPMAQLGLDIPPAIGLHAFYNFEPPFTSNIVNSGNVAGNGIHYDVVLGTTTATISNANYEDVTLELIPLTLTTNATACLGETITLSVNNTGLPYTWQYSFNGGAWTTFASGSTATTTTFTPATAGSYEFSVSNTMFSCTETDLFTVDVTACCPAANDPLFTTVTGTISSDMFWDGKIYIPDNTIIFVDNGAILDITTADVVFGDCSGIDFSDGAVLRANNSVFRPCATDGTWRGITFQKNSGDDHQINENTFKNAVIALYFDSSDGAINSNSLINCNVGVEVIGGSFDQAIFGNNFLINNMLPVFDQCGQTTNSNNLIGVLSDHAVFRGSISENQFMRSNDDPSRFFTGVENITGGGTISQNMFSNATNAIVITSPSSIVTIENNEIELNNNYGITAQITAQISLLNVAGPIVRVKTNEIYNTSQETASQRYGIYANGCSNVSIENNIVDGFSDAIAAFLSGSFNISENVITNASIVGIYLEASLIAQGSNYITCNDVTMEVGAGSGIWTVNTTEGTEISSNCIKDSDMALRTHGSPSLAMPFIRNNYLYNYRIGIENSQYSGAIGTVGSPGLNTLWSNNNSAVDIFSDVAITAADNFGMFNISMFLVGITSNNPYHSTASCGHQIYNMPSQGNFNTDYNCDHWTGVISPLQQQGEELIVSNPSEAGAMIESTENSFTLLLRVLVSEEWSDELMNDFITKADLSDHEMHLAKLYFYKAFGRFDEALIELAQLDPAMLVDNYKLAEDLSIQLSSGQAISENEIVSNADLISDLGVTSDLFASVSHFSPVHFQYNLKSIEQVDTEVNETAILRIPKASVEMFAYPNPFEDFVTIRVVNGNEFENQELHIYDLTGVLIKTYALELMSGEVKVDLSGFAPGTYFVSLNTSPESKVKLVKLK